MEQADSENAMSYEVMLGTIRRRRWYLWTLILVYLPATITMLKLTESVKATAVLFGIWFILLCTAVALMAASKCPRCGNNFHVRNSTLSIFPRCCHCGLTSGARG